MDKLNLLNEVKADLNKLEASDVGGSEYVKGLLVVSGKVTQSDVLSAAELDSWCDIMGSYIAGYMAPDAELPTNYDMGSMADLIDVISSFIG